MNVINERAVNTAHSAIQVVGLYIIQLLVKYIERTAQLFVYEREKMDRE